MDSPLELTKWTETLIFKSRLFSLPYYIFKQHTTAGHSACCPSTANKWELGKNPTTSQIFADRLRSATLQWWALTKHSSGRSDRSRCQGETPAARTLSAGSSTEQLWAMFGSQWWEHTLEMTLQELYNPYWLFRSQGYFEELSINQSACSSCSHWDWNMV